MKRILIKNKTFCLIVTILVSVTYFSFTNFAFASEVYSHGETVTIGEFIYNDDYTPTTDDCSVSIYSPSGTVLVDNVTMSDNATGWHYYSYTAPSTEGKYPSFITCGTLVGGDLLKLDKTFIIKNSIPDVSADISTIKSNVATLISEVGTGNISAIKTKTDTIAWSDVTGLVTSNGDIKAKTDTIAWSDVTAIKTNTDTIAWTDVTGIKTKTDTIAWTDIGDINLTATAIKAKTDTINWSDIASLPANIWSYSARTLSSFGTLVADVWGNATRTLTSPSASSTWSVNMSDFGTISAGQSYMATVTTVYDGTLTDSANTPVITVYDPNRNVVVNNVAMTRTSVGTYTYSYTTNSGATGGVWESVVLATVEEGKTLSSNDYWNVTTSPTQVLILGMNNTVVPNIKANVRITNEGSAPYEYHYEWCVVSSLNNLCGGGDDVFYASASKLIDPGDDFDTVLSSTVNNVGDYYFKVVVYYGTEKSGASRSFTATQKNSGGNSGGGGSGVEKGNPKGADFNGDSVVNSVDFSILLAFWKTKPPFTNPYVDINKDSMVNSIDFSILLSRWGSKSV